MKDGKGIELGLTKSNYEYFFVVGRAPHSLETALLDIVKSRMLRYVSSNQMNLR